MISLAVCWLFQFLLDLLSMFNAFSDCAFRSLARSGLSGGWLICTPDFLNFCDLYSPFDLLGRSWGVLGPFLGTSVFEVAF